MTLAIPNANVPPMDGGGAWTQAWWRFFASVAQSVNSQATGANPQPVTVGASPYTFTAGQAGALLVQGGGVSAMAFSRDGLTWYPLGSFYGLFPLSPGDMVRITYPGAAPVLTFVPR